MYIIKNQSYITENIANIVLTRFNLNSVKELNTFIKTETGESINYDELIKVTNNIIKFENIDKKIRQLRNEIYKEVFYIKTLKKILIINLLSEYKNSL